MELHEKVKKIRDDFGLSRREFGERLGVSENVIVNIEYDRLKRPEQKEPLLRLICKEFHVNESWLRYDEGNPYDEPSQSEKLLDFFGSIASGNDNQGLKILMQSLANLGPEYWAQASEMLDKLLEESRRISEE